MMAKKYFVRCLTYQPSESVAMWHIYGYPRNVMLKFKGSYLRRSLSLNKTSGKHDEMLHCLLDAGSMKLEVNIPQNYLKIYDVLYYVKSSNNKSSDDIYYVEKGSFNSKEIKGSQLKNINERYLKRAAFAYERETRFYFALDDAAMNEIFEINGIQKGKNVTYNQVKNIKVYLDEDYAEDDISVFKSPSFLKPKEEGESKLFDKVQQLEKIDSWGLKVQKSLLDDGSDF